MNKVALKFSSQIVNLKEIFYFASLVYNLKQAFTFFSFLFFFFLLILMKCVLTNHS